MNARHYDPATGAFLQPDPLGISADELYAYARSNPYRFWDPTGWDPRRLDSSVEFSSHGAQSATIGDFFRAEGRQVETGGFVPLFGALGPGATFGVGETRSGRALRQLRLGVGLGASPFAVRSAEVPLDLDERFMGRFNTVSIVLELGISIPMSSAQVLEITAFTIRLGVANTTDAGPPIPILQFSPMRIAGVSAGGLKPPRLIGVFGIETLAVGARQ
jgi:hypothetical protein